MDRQITIKGIGRYKANPDTVEITVNISRRAWLCEDAVHDEERAYRDLIARMRSCGFEEEELKTSAFTVKKLKKRFKEEYVDDGYECNQTVTIRFPIYWPRMSEVLSVLSRAGNGMEIGVAFTIEDTESAKNLLLESAAHDAQTKAYILTSATGVKLGKLVSINYNWTDRNFYSEMEYRSDCMESDCAEFNPAGIDMEGNVTFIWEIED